jgi:hypothetical protein
MDSQLYYYILLTIFGVIAYMIIVDSNVGQFIILLLRMARVQVSRAIFWIKFYPRLRFDTAILKWKSKRMINKVLKDTEK